jgi:hypothetical protein
MLCKTDNVDDVIGLLAAFQVRGVMLMPVLWGHSVCRFNFFAAEGEGFFGSEVLLPNIPEVAIFAEAPWAPCKVHEGQSEVAPDEV